MTLREDARRAPTFDQSKQQATRNDNAACEALRKVLINEHEPRITRYETTLEVLRW